MFRKIMICIMAVTYLFGMGIAPLMGIYNKNIMIGGIPCFLIGIYTVAILLVLEAFILYLVEKKDDDELGN